MTRRGCGRNVRQGSEGRYAVNMSLGAETVVARLKRMVSDRSRRTICAHALLLVLLWSAAWARPANEAGPQVELGAELVSKRFSRLRQSCSLSRAARVRDGRASKRVALCAWLAIDSGQASLSARSRTLRVSKREHKVVTRPAGSLW